MTVREIKALGFYKKENIGKAYKYSLFECPTCSTHVEKIRKDGLRSHSCSQACYSKNRTGVRRGRYEEKIFSKGYFLIYRPDHPHATGTKKLYVAEHRLIAEEKIGRYLTNDEVVHHKNGIKTDNRPENLQVMTASEHSQLHANERMRMKNGSFDKI